MKTKGKGKKIVPVHGYVRTVNGHKVRVPGHRRSTPCPCGKKRA